MTTTNILSVDVARPGDTVFLRGNIEQIIHDHDLTVLVEQLADRDVHVVFVNAVDAVIDGPAPPAAPAQPSDDAIPTECGVYVDRDDDVWYVDSQGTIHGVALDGAWAPDDAHAIASFAPYRKLA